MDLPDPISVSDPYPTKPDSKKGCGMVILLAAAAIWIILTGTTFTLVGWFVEQFMFEGSFDLPDLVRWAIGLAGIGLAVLPTVILAAVIKSQPHRAIFRSWLMAGLFSLLVIPARLVPLTASHVAAVVQVMGCLAFLFGMGTWIWRHKNRYPTGWWKIHLPGFGHFLFIPLFLLVPWILWGALGSPADLFLGLMISLLTGLSAVTILGGILFPVTLNSGDYSRRNAIRDGFVSAVMLIILVSGLGHSGNQWLLLAAVPIAGFVLPWVGVSTQHGETRFNWMAGILFTSLIVAWPILWFDADELMLVTSMGSGEGLEWAGLAVLAAVALEAFAMIVFFILFHKPRTGTGRLSWLVTAAAAVIIAGIYILYGRPGWFGERLFVVLNDQADVSRAASISNYNERRSYVFNTLVGHAEKTQAGLRADLQALGIKHQPYYLVNAVEVSAGPLVRLWLSTRPEVDRILDNPILRPLPVQPPAASGSALAPAQPEWNLTSIGVPAAWNQFNARGQGIIIGQSDSGVQGNHPDLSSTYKGRSMGDDYNWLDPWNHSRQPVDIGGHGTHTLGSILGQKTGVAPGAQWIGCVNLARNLGNPAVYLDCWQFLLAPYPQNGDAFKDGDPARGAHVLNNSWGCPEVEGCDPAAFLPAVKALKAAGIFVVVSAGNSGSTGCGSVSDPPSIYEEVLTIGAVNRFSQLADFSSMGPVTVDGSRRTKPDLVAPGVDVLSTFPGSTYAQNSGTSMAGPHVAGVVALMWSANPALIGNIGVTRQILVETADSYTGKFPACVATLDTPNNAVGFGVVNALKAVRSAVNFGKKP